MRRLVHASLALCALVASAASAHAQALGPQRQFLAIEPYYEHLSVDASENPDRGSLNGFGGRLWINTDPFHFIPNGSLALFASYLSPRSFATGTGTETQRDHSVGAEYDQYFARRPLSGLIDPFVTLGYERYTTRNSGSNGSRTFNGLPVGGGVRIPLPNRVELRGDLKDLVLFSVPGTLAPNVPTSGLVSPPSRTTHNLLLQAALGLTF